MSTPTVQAMLVHLSFKYGKQGGTDKEITAAICAQNNASDKSLKATKRVLCKEAMDPLKKLAGELSTRLKRITTAWDIDGVYICKPANVAKVIALRDEYFPAFDILKASHLMENYDVWKEMTREQNGAAFKESEFPSREELSAAVTRSISIMPLPESDVLRRIKDIDATLMEELMKSNDERIQSGIRAGMEQAYTKLIDPLNHMVTVLSSDKPKIYETLIENVRGVIAEIPGLNLTDDSALARFAVEAERMLSTIDTDMLRSDPVVRKETADKAAEILSTFGVLGRRQFAA